MITNASDSGLWFTMNQGNAIGRVIPEAPIEIHPLPTPGAAPVRITSTTRTVWFVGYGLSI